MINQIAILTREYPLYSNRGGIATFFEGLSDVLSKSNDVVVVTEGLKFDDESLTKSNNCSFLFPSLRFNSRLSNRIIYKSPVALLRKLAYVLFPDVAEKIEWSFYASYWLKKTYPDIKVIHSCEYDFPFLFSRFFFPSAKIIIHSESPQLFLRKYVEEKWENVVKSRIEIMATVKSADLVVACSSQLYDFWKHKHVKRVEFKSNFVNNGVWKSIMKPLKSIDRDENQTHLVFIGRLEYRKGVDLLLKIFTYYKKHYSDSVGLHLIGRKTKTFQVKNKLLDFDQYVTEENIDKSFIHIEHIDNKDQMRLYISKLRGKIIYVHLARYEPCSLAIIEAMSMGLPVVTTHVAGKDIIINNSTGFLVNPFTKITSETLHGIITNWKETRVIAQSGQQYAHKNLSSKSNQIFYRELYRELLK